MQIHLVKKITTCMVAVAVSAVAFPAYAEILKAEFSYSIVEVDQTGTEVLVERNSVRPGETIQYLLSHKNQGEDELSGLVLGVPIPQGVTLSVGVQTSSVPAVFEIQGELDPEAPGLEWSTWPAERQIIQADGTRVIEPLPASDVEAVRWTLDGALPAGESAVNSYRVVVN